MAIARQEPTVDTWHSLYKETWKGNIVDAAFQHPAKFSKALIFKIVDHAISEGWVRKGDTVIDPFGGVGLGGLPCGLRGLHHVGVELEPRFVTLANGGECGGDIAKHEACTDSSEHGPHHILGNLELWQRKYGVLPQWKPPILLQGDSRNLCQIIETHADLLVSSSPYGQSTHVNNNPQDMTAGRAEWANGTDSAKRVKQDYAEYAMPSNLGNLPMDSIDTVMSSPPYADGCTHTGGADPQPQHVQGGPLRYVQYGAHCIITSPPFADTFHGQSDARDHAARERAAGTRLGGGQINHARDYGTSTGQLGNMPPGDVAAVVQGDLCASSPPFQQSDNRGNRENLERIERLMIRDGRTNSTKLGASIAQDYGHTNGQLGNTQGDTFWSAAKTILEQTWAVLRPGAHAIWVTKHYIRDGKLVDFPGQWKTLCEHIGFVTLHIHLAMLVERRTVLDLFEGTRAYEEWFESFFRKINRRKSGIGIEFETVICQAKPLTAASMPPDEAWHQLPLVEVADACVSSSPYAGRGEVLGTHNGIDWSKATGTGQRLTPGRDMYRYSANRDNLGNLPEGQRP